MIYKHRLRAILFICCFFLVIPKNFAITGFNASVQNNDSVNHKRLRTLEIGSSTLYVASMGGLYSLWYTGYAQSSFHFINDDSEWLQMDKGGHITTSFYLGLLGYESMRWAGVNEKKSTWMGGLTGLAFLTTIEVMDGFSAEWGFSTGDMAANTLGSALFISQQLAWHQPKVLLKWSFHLTDYAKYNPGLLGKTFTERALKDYNGQTFWLSGNLQKFGLVKSPKWLSLAIGYGAEGMTGATANPETMNGKIIPPFTRYRQFYIAPDIDLTSIRVKSKLLQMVFKGIGFIKFPMPAIEFNKRGLKFHPLYF